MNIAGWFARIRKAVTIAHRHRSNYRTLAHLDDHLLRDIGLYVDQGIVRPLHPKTTETNVPMVAPGTKTPWRRWRHL
ncbi:DUF1127 domain-containing protein [Modicisalibacter luteus]|uniref:DUF1127 domain-containing protein n=1 Tax=Modicisalibacter luteus TaxID=453962 RepID=UPI003634C6D1